MVVRECGRSRPYSLPTVVLASTALPPSPVAFSKLYEHCHGKLAALQECCTLQNSRPTTSAAGASRSVQCAPI